MRRFNLDEIWASCDWIPIFNSKTAGEGLSALTRTEPLSACSPPCELMRAVPAVAAQWLVVAAAQPIHQESISPVLVPVLRGSSWWSCQASTSTAYTNIQQTLVSCLML